MRNTRAFTLLELLIVLLIIGILIAIGLYRYQSVVEAADAKKAQAEVRAGFINASAYKTKNDGYGNTADMVDDLDGKDGIQAAAFNNTEAGVPEDGVGVYVGSDNEVLLVKKGEDGVVYCMSDTGNEIVNGKWIEEDGCVETPDPNTTNVVSADTPIIFSGTAYDEGNFNGYQLYSMDPTSQEITPLSLTAGDGPENNGYIPTARWSPNHNRIMFVKGYGMRIINPDNTNMITLLPDWSGSQGWLNNSLIGYYSSVSGTADVYSVNATSNAVQLTDDPASDAFPSTASKTGLVAFASNRQGGQEQICTMNVNGSNEQCLTNYPGISALYPIIDPEGEYIYFLQSPGGLYRINADGTDAATPTLIFANALTSEYSLSQDGTKISYIDRLTNEIFVIDSDGNQSSKIRVGSNITTGGGNIPAWSEDGSKVIYRCTNSGGSLCMADTAVADSATVIPGTGAVNPVTVSWYGHMPTG